jgi:hypothetical protein
MDFVPGFCSQIFVPRLNLRFWIFIIFVPKISKERNYAEGTNHTEQKRKKPPNISKGTKSCTEEQILRNSGTNERRKRRVLRTK